MKPLRVQPLVSIALGILLFASAQADVLVQWNFNYPLSADMTGGDDSVLTGTNVPSIGTGTFSLVGGTMLQPYNSGSPNCPPCDPFYAFTANNPQTGPNTNNSAISIVNFPAQGTANRTAGVEISLSTVGHTNISVSWEQRHQQRTGRYYRLQYSLDGVNFNDVPAEQGGVIAVTVQNIFMPQTNWLSGVHPGVENNPNLKLRLVGEFESTAAPGGAEGDNYVASTIGTAAEYRTTSEVRLDMFTVYGEPSGAPLNEFPTVSITQETMNTVGSATITNTFTLGDAETPVDSLIVTAASDSTPLVPNANITLLDTTGALRRVAVTPAPSCDNPGGMANVSITVTDGNGQATATSFQVTVESGLPSIMGVTDVKSLKNTPVITTFSVADLDTPPAGISVHHTGSSIPAVILPAEIVPSGTGVDRTATLTPQTDGLGGTVVSLGVTDGTCSATNSFLYMVVPHPDVILYDSFNNYPDGPLTTDVGGGVWLNVVDTPGAVQIQSQALRLNTTAQEEFVRAPLFGRGTYTETDGVPLYAAMKVTLLALPASPTPGINTHIGHFSGPGSPGAQRSRFFASIDGAEPGFYRIGISSSVNVPNAYLATNLSPNVTYTVLSYYNPATGVARLWVNPASESDAFVEAADTQTADIHFYALRQRAAGADALIDDLVVATSFEGALLISAPTLQVSLSDDGIKLSWPMSAGEDYELYSTTSLSAPDWQLATEPRMTEGDDYFVDVPNPTGTRFYRLQK